MKKHKSLGEYEIKIDLINQLLEEYARDIICQPSSLAFQERGGEKH